MTGEGLRPGPIARMFMPPERTDRDCCSRCGNIFPSAQVCDGCVTDAEKFRAAIAVIRKRARQTGKEPFTVSVFLRVLERHADRLERG